VRLGVLTGGGDCPGLNAAIRAVVRRANVTYEDEVVGFRDGWRGVVEDDATPLDVAACRGILPRGGTLIGTSRFNPCKVAGDAQRALETLDRRGIEALVAIGGEGTLAVARDLAANGAPIVGVPKTIDNDVGGTDVTIGFHTAVQIATDAIDRLHTTAESHDRVIVCEVMGRNAGWIAVYAGLAGGAAVVLAPEEPFDIAAVCDHLKRRHAKGRFASLVVVAEGAKPIEGTIALPPSETDVFDHERLGGISAVIAAEVEARIGLEARMTILGHVQRGGTPTAFDRVLATRLGVAAVDGVHQQRFGSMVGVHGPRVDFVPLADALAVPKRVPRDLIDRVAGIFAD
jgi:ATP-dependent phosphofructokinase / diphosphate-dependent phosphofructokinase